MGVAAGIVVLIGLILPVRLAIYRSLYKYDPIADYQYAFPGGRCLKVPVRVSGSAFVWPGADWPWDTAFLRLRVESSLAGWFSEPSIEAWHDGQVSRQYFERGASGVRFVNVGLVIGIAAVAGDTVSLRGNWMGWPSQEATLLLFSNRDLWSERVLVIAPHPDDAEIAAFGLYSQTNAHVVTVTAGEAGGKKYAALLPDPRAHSLVKGRMRAWDSVVVPMLGGVVSGNALNLGYFDGTLRGMYLSPGKPAASKFAFGSAPRSFRQFNQNDVVPPGRKDATWDGLVRDLQRVLAEVNPGVIVAPHPWLDRHHDHQFTAVALLQALKAANLPDGDLYLYTNHAVHSEIYPFGPRNSGVTLPPWFDSAAGFRGVYCHPLDEEARMDKLFALEAMHGLRPAPHPEGYSTKWLLTQAFRNLYDAARDLPRDTHSYFRKAVRSNELFLVHYFSDADRILTWFLNKEGLLPEKRDVTSVARALELSTPGAARLASRKASD